MIIIVNFGKRVGRLIIALTFKKVTKIIKLWMFKVKCESKIRKMKEWPINLNELLILNLWTTLI